MMKQKTKLLALLVIFSILSASFFPSTTQAANTTNQPITTEAVYDLTVGGTQEFTITDQDGNLAHVTVSEEISGPRIANGTYKVSYTSTGCWKASYYVAIKNNSITSVHTPSIITYAGSIITNNLVRESSKQASYYLSYRLNSIHLSTGVRSIISGTTLKTFGI